MMCLAACSDDASSPKDVVLDVVSAAEEVSASALALPQTVVVRVLTRDGKPVANTEVNWRVLEGGGSVSAYASHTNAEGHATVQWTLGPGTGLQILLATSGIGSISISARARSGIIAIAAGYRHTCAVASNGRAYCWGAGDHGELGNGNAVATDTPVAVQSNIPFRSITAGWSHTCALSTGGAAFCWGDNHVNQLGTADPLSGYATPRAVRFAGPFTELSAGFVHTCGVTTAGEVVCWGENRRGQLSGAAANEARITTAQFTRVAVGEFHSCGLRADSVAVCWGWNSAGELGTHAPLGAVNATPAAVFGELEYHDIASGARHSCGVNAQGKVHCWGLNGSGEIGRNPLVNSTTPFPIASTNSFADVAIGGAHACAIDLQQLIYCWGAAMVNGAAQDTQVPSGPVGGTTRRYHALSAGYEHTCALSMDDEVWCWGSNLHGQLGISGVASSSNPVRVPLPGS